MGQIKNIKLHIVTDIKSEMDETNDCIVKARGLPWSATTKDVAAFFEDCNIVGDESGIHLTMDRNGRPSGECFIGLASLKDVEKAKAHNKENMGKRYIEIQDAKRAEMEWFVSRMPGAGGNKMGLNESDSDGFVRLRGLPFEATKKDIAAYGITLTMDQDGRPSGDAYVEFTSPEEAGKALKKNKERIGHRYIEIFKSSKYDVKYVVPSHGQGGGFSHMGGRPGPYDRPGYGMNMSSTVFNGGGNFGGRNPRGGPGGPVRAGRNMGGKGMESSTTGHMVHMRGLPFGATQGDVYLFLAPLNPVEVRIVYEESGRPKGECDVDFHTHSDAEAAMLKNKQNMGHRYIEMFLRSVPENGNGWSSNSGFNQSNNPSGIMNSGGSNSTDNVGYGSGFVSGGMGGSNNGSSSGGEVGGGGGQIKEEFGIGGGEKQGGNSGGYSSFSDKTSYASHPSSGNYYSTTR